MNNMWKPTKPQNKEFKKQSLLKTAKICKFIYQLGESSLLNQPAIEIKTEDITGKDIQQKIKYIQSCLLEYRKITGYGRGIAAVQVGIPDKIAVIYTPAELITIINPKITRLSQKQLKFPEMCMSTGNVISPIIRPSWIEFEYYNQRAEKQKWSITDDTAENTMLNRVFQHEIDHLNGIICISKATSLKDLSLETNPNFYNSTTFEEV